MSATCHMPDVIEAPYRPAMLGEAEAGAAFDAILSLADGDRLDGVLAMISGKEA